MHSGNSSGAQQIKGKTFVVIATQCPLSLLLIAISPNSQSVSGPAQAITNSEVRGRGWDEGVTLAWPIR